jgi:glycosyltransferase involved in cell wall biosynthesis
MIEPEVSGLLVAPDVFGEALAWALEHPEELRSMGRQARERAGLFSVSETATRSEDFYRLIVANYSPVRQHGGLGNGGA